MCKIYEVLFYMLGKIIFGSLLRNGYSNQNNEIVCSTTYSATFFGNY